MQHNQCKWGRPRDDIYGPYDHSFTASDTPKQHTTQPIVTGTSVIGMKFNNGVILAADNLASYGSMRRFDNQERLLKVGSETVIGASGDISDLQTLQDDLQDLEIEESYDDPSQLLRAPNVQSYLQRVMYQRRSKLDPFWNSLLVAGFKDGEPFLSFIDLLGTTYTSPTLATGLGSHLATPLLRKVVDKDGDEKNVSEEQARKAIDDAMRVLFYRDCRASDKYSVAVVRKTEAGQPEVIIEVGNKVEDQNWLMAKGVLGKTHIST